VDNILCLIYVIKHDFPFYINVCTLVNRIINTVIEGISHEDVYPYSAYEQQIGLVRTVSAYEI